MMYLKLSDRSKARIPDDLYKMVDKTRGETSRWTTDDFISGLLKPNIMFNNGKIT